jgi:hypothetical protein
MGKRPGTRNRATIIAEEMLDSAARPLLRGASTTHGAATAS